MTETQKLALEAVKDLCQTILSAHEELEKWRPEVEVPTT